MPCGGIYPVRENNRRTCFACGHVIPAQDKAYEVEEWDAAIHSYCLDPFLKCPEGEIVLAHGHQIVRWEK